VAASTGTGPTQRTAARSSPAATWSTSDHDSVRGLYTRGYHGQVLAPFQFSGIGRYEVIRNVLPISAPRRLEDLVERRQYERSPLGPPGVVVDGALGQAALDATAGRLATQRQPGPNQALNDAALAMGALAAYGVLDHDVAWDALRGARASMGCFTRTASASASRRPTPAGTRDSHKRRDNDDEPGPTNRSQTRRNAPTRGVRRANVHGRRSRPRRTSPRSRSAGCRSRTFPTA
jgi:hypothetical protein